MVELLVQSQGSVVRVTPKTEALLRHPKLILSMVTAVWFPLYTFIQFKFQEKKDLSISTFQVELVLSYIEFFNQYFRGGGHTLPFCQRQNNNPCAYVFVCLFSVD